MIERYHIARHLSGVAAGSCRRPARLGFDRVTWGLVHICAPPRTECLRSARDLADRDAMEETLRDLFSLVAAPKNASIQADSDHRRATKTIAAALPEVTEQDIHSPQP